MDKLANGEYFAFPKRTHGVWDHVSIHDAQKMVVNDYHLCDQVIFKGKMENSPEVQEIRDEYLCYLDELINDISVSHKSNNYYQTVSLGLDYLSRRLSLTEFDFNVRADPRLVDYWQVDYHYEDFFENHNLWDHCWTYAQVFTQGVVSQTILQLPLLAKQYHVVVLGPEKLRDLDQRWELEPDRFTFFPAPRWPPSRPKGNIFIDPVLPPLQTFRSRYEMLDQLLSIPSDRPKLYLFEAGTCSQWWIYRMFQKAPNHFYIDVGRVLELRYPDYVWPFKPNIKRFYRKAARAYYGEKRYGQLINELFQKQENKPWLPKS
jgi:hypothetical protein